MYPSLHCKGSKRLFKVLLWEGVGDRTELKYIDPTLMAISVVSFSFSRCSTGGPGAQLSAECWLSLPHLVTNWSPKLLGTLKALSAGSGFLYHILSASSLDPNSQGTLMALSAWCGLPYHISSITSTLTFFRFSHKPPRASGAWRHPHPVIPFRLGLLWHLSDSSIRPRAPAITPASMLHLTNPCAELKGSQPN